jgi:hypothetical protein
MAISPTRAFALGACSILVIAGVFVAGIGIGARSDGDPSELPATRPAQRIECPSPPGFTATKAANERLANCEDAQRVQSMLLESGATAANVTVSREESGELLGPESVTVVTAQVDLPMGLDGDWNAESAALAISRQLGTTTSRVTITDERLEVLYDGGARDTAVTAGPQSRPLGAPTARSTAAPTAVPTARSSIAVPAASSRVR